MALRHQEAELRHQEALTPGTNTAPPSSRAGIRSHPHVARDAPRGGGASCDPKAAAPTRLDYVGAPQPTPSRHLRTTNGAGHSPYRQRESHRPVSRPP
ncbi:hypothetical protein MTO96_013712 [Rhipicephalus appendiculatus]